MIYFIEWIGQSRIKIGYSANIKQRVGNLASEFGNLRLLGVMDGDRRIDHAPDPRQ